MKKPYYKELPLSHLYDSGLTGSQKLLKTLLLIPSHFAPKPANEQAAAKTSPQATALTAILRSMLLSTFSIICAAFKIKILPSKF